MASATVTYPGRSIEWNLITAHGGTQPKYFGWGDSTSAGSVVSGCLNSDVNLFDPRTEARATGSYTFATSAWLADQVVVAGTLTCAGTSGAIREVGIFDASALSPTSTLTASGASGLTGSQVVGSTVGFPASGTGNYYAQINNEAVVANTVDATHVNLVTRGALGSTAAAYTAGATITVGGDGGASGMASAVSAQTVGTPTGGSMWLHADFAPINLNIGDSIAFTAKDQFT